MFLQLYSGYNPYVPYHHNDSYLPYSVPPLHVPKFDSCQVLHGGPRTVKYEHMATNLGLLTHGGVHPAYHTHTDHVGEGEFLAICWHVGWNEICKDILVISSVRPFVHPSVCLSFLVHFFMMAEWIFFIFGTLIRHMEFWCACYRIGLMINLSNCDHLFIHFECLLLYLGEECGDCVHIWYHNRIPGVEHHWAMFWRWNELDLHQA